jgi:hypothetical protein
MTTDRSIGVPGECAAWTPNLAITFVELADSVVDEYDGIELLQTLTERRVELHGVAAAGRLIADQRGALQLAVSSSEQVRLIDLFES